MKADECFMTKFQLKNISRAGTDIIHGDSELKCGCLLQGQISISVSTYLANICHCIIFFKVRSYYNPFLSIVTTDSSGVPPNCSSVVLMNRFCYMY